MNSAKCRVVCFLSGKGGSGKTTVAIAIAKLLSDIGFPTLLIDFDLATNGASYFFRPQFDQASTGIWESLTTRDSATAQLNGANKLPILLKEGFHFVASRCKLGSKGKTYDSFKFDKNVLITDILEPLFHWANSRDITYVLIDCQAGYSISSEAAAQLSQKAVIVTEADAISSDAAENLLVQMGEALVGERRYLVNKIDIRDAETYRQMRNVFQALNRLPPLPFDFAVRNAFGARKIPVQLDQPSSLLFALFETMKLMFDEIYDELEVFKAQHVDRAFEKYDHEMDTLLAERRKAQQGLAEIQFRRVVFRERLYRFATILGLVGIFVLTLSTGVSTYFDFVLTPVDMFESQEFFILRQRIESGLITMGVIMGSIVAGFALYAWRRHSRMKVSDEIRNAELARKEESLSRELDKFRSLLWTRSQELLVDTEVTREVKYDVEMDES